LDKSELSFQLEFRTIGWMSENQSPDPVTKKQFVWPWIVVMMVLIGIALAVLSMRREAQRIQNQRQYEIPRESH